MKNDEITTESSISKDASITNPSRSFVRLRGSHSSSQALKGVTNLRKPGNGDDDPFPDDDPPTDPPPPPPQVSTPDLAIQISFCLPGDLNNNIVSAVGQALGGSADVRTTCLNGSQRIGVWLRPFVNQEDNQARNRGLERINVIGSGETLTFFINASLIRRQAVEGWNAAPKRLNGDGVPDAGGPIHLTGFSLSFEGPNKVVTRVDGFDERPWPDVDFRLTTTDTLSVSGGKVSCESVPNLDVDTSWLNFLTGLFLFLLPPLGIVFLVERIIISTVDAPDAHAGAGCGAAALIPEEIIIPQGNKVVASYTRLNVSNGGIFAGGSFVVIPRAPEATIAGPRQLSVAEGITSLSRNYSVSTEDMRPPLQIAWSGDGFITHPHETTASFRFDLSGAQAGHVLTKRVSVRVTDADGLVGSAGVNTAIHIIPEIDDDRPPVCRVKPWLPQCQLP